MANWYLPASVALAFVVSHISKELIHLARTGEFSWYTLLMETGGMPSSHSAVVSALAAAVFYTQGLSLIFWVVLVFAMIIIRDAFGVRKSVSDQATVLNTLLSQQEAIEHKVEVILGHTPLQAVVGVIVGVGCASLLAVWPF